MVALTRGRREVIEV